MKRKGMAFLVVSLWLGASQFATTQDVIFIVRHADRASSEPDSLLSKAGEARRSVLRRFLRRSVLRRFLRMSPSNRSTRRRSSGLEQTAAPVAAEFHIQPKIVPRAV
jgi:hypothetical protein